MCVWPVHFVLFATWPSGHSFNRLSNYKNTVTQKNTCLPCKTQWTPGADRRNEKTIALDDYINQGNVIPSEDHLPYFAGVACTHNTIKMCSDCVQQIQTATVDESTWFKKHWIIYISIQMFTCFSFSTHSSRLFLQQQKQASAASSSSRSRGMPMPRTKPRTRSRSLLFICSLSAKGHIKPSKDKHLPIKALDNKAKINI